MLAGVHQAAVSQHMTAFCLFLVSMGLDAVDGWLARKLGQVGTACHWHVTLISRHVTTAPIHPP